MPKQEPHLTLEGLLQIIAIKSLFPKDLNELLSNVFTPSALPSVTKSSFSPPTADPLDPDWIAGFTNGDGHFTLGYKVRSNYHLGAINEPYFKVTQDARDKILLGG